MSGQFSHPSRRVLLYELGMVPYQQAWAWQQRLVAQRKQDSCQPDALMLLEHPPVYTLGQGASEAYLKFDPGATDIELHRIERGGEVTYHCPGQLVGYPILNLRHYRQDLHWYLRGLESVLINALGMYGLSAYRIDGLTGVWIEGYKVAAIGIKVSRWITMHGFALNICPNLSGFQKIVPCGIEDRSVGSLIQFMPQLKFTDVSDAVQRSFEKVFGVRLQAAKWSVDEG
ncbi:MAG: lipoyl(octanoyl) transferase LipB [Cyanobacteria bacterium P01_D01_bin.44]